MRGAAMSLTAAASGFVVFLLSVPVIQGQNGWGVTYTSTQICAVKGSTVEIRCSYTYPSIWQGVATTVEQRFWFIQPGLDLTSVSEYSGRVQYSSNNKDCTLRISDLRETDSAEYKFRFITNHEGGIYTGLPGVTLSVTALQMQVNKVTFNQSVTQAELSCLSSCSKPSYVWIKNGQKVPEEASSYTAYLNPGDSIACALKANETYHTPLLYAPSLPSVSVSPSGEIMEGSSVTLTCSRDANIVANYTWYKKIPNQKEKRLSEEPQLVFSSIQSSDSGQYYCRAENQLGTKKSTSISIDVKYSVRDTSVIISPTDPVSVGSVVNLTCSCRGDPPVVNFVWFMISDGRLELIKVNTQVYRFNVTNGDRGRLYFCGCRNDLDIQLSTGCQLIFKGEPVDVEVLLKTLGVIMLVSTLVIFECWFRSRRSTEPAKDAGEAVYVNSAVELHPS